MVIDAISRIYHSYRITSIAAFTIGFIILFHGVSSHIVTFKSFFWHSTEGTITESDYATMVMCHSPQIDLLLDIRYEFIVDDVIYANDRVFAQEKSFSNVSEIEKVVHEYPEASTVTVYYNPSNPKESVLDKSNNWYFLFLSLLFMILGHVLKKD